MTEPFLIAAHCSSDEARLYHNAPPLVKEKYDSVISSDDFKLNEETDEMPLGYKKLYMTVKEELNDNSHRLIITVGGDNSISASTVSAFNDHYDNDYKPGLRVLWVDASPDILPYELSTSFDQTAVSQLVGICDPSLVNNKKWLNYDQIAFLGLRDLSDEDKSYLDDHEFEYYTMEKVNQLGLETVVNSLLDLWKDHPIFVVFDMRAFDPTLTPSVMYPVAKGLDYYQMELIASLLKNKIVAMDLTGFTPEQDAISNRRTGEVMRYLMSNLGGIKERMINIFTEESSFLIYRSIEQLDEDDIGWFILRGIPTKLNEQLLKSIPNDTIISVPLDTNESEQLVANTTIRDQNMKSYYQSRSILDLALFPQEKSLMHFELVTSYIDHPDNTDVDKSVDGESKEVSQTA